MYVIIVYDVNVKRVAKVHTFLRTHLTWVQNSVFEGEVEKAQLLAIKRGLQSLIKKTDDTIVIYSALRMENLQRQILGIIKNYLKNIVA